MVDALRLGRAKGLYDLWAYVLMPEHVHLVVWPHHEVTIADVLKTVKQSVSKRALLWLQDNDPIFVQRLEDVQPNGRRSLRFWQRGGGYDRNLRSVADVHEKINYVHENPVRRRLVSEPALWPWSSYLAWTTGEDKPIAIDRESVPVLMV
jgi:putative transposase